MKLYLQRYRYRLHTTDGVLKNQDGRYVCCTTENTMSMLPPGTYQLQLSRHPKLQTKCPLLISTDEPQHQTWMIRGNGAYKDGSQIVVGRYLVPGVVIKSKRYFSLLIDRLKKVLSRDGEVVVEIRGSISLP